MFLFTTIFHIILCVGLILIILLQPGKDSSDVFGGASPNKQSRGSAQANPLGKLTNATAIFFMLTSITLAWYSSASARSSSNIEDDIRDLEKVLSKEDIEFEIPKLFITADSLMSQPPAPTEVIEQENVEGEDPSLENNPTEGNSEVQVIENDTEEILSIEQGEELTAPE